MLLAPRTSMPSSIAASSSRCQTEGALWNTPSMTTTRFTEEASKP
jgi:hypothetical protein